MAEDNTRKIPVMLHRAILGSLERFIGILIENYTGAFPVWLAPEQVVVMNISRGQNDYARSVHNQLKQNGIRASLDLRNEKITYKIREHSLQKLPYQVIVGDEEMNTDKISVRNRVGVDLGQMTVHDFVNTLKDEIATKK
mgnify:FL=1